MYILPILVSSKHKTDLKQFWLFLERNGNHLIELDATPETAVAAARDFLETNGMQPLGDPILANDIAFVTIDPASKDLSSFYTWREVPPGTIPTKEVWRSFLWLTTDSSADPLGVNRLLEAIPLADHGHSAFSVVSSYLKTCY
jgi:hypothetical protein